MSLGLTMSPRQTLSLRQSQELSLSTTMTLCQKLSATLRALRSDGNNNPPEVLDDVINAVIALFGDKPEIQAALTALFSSPIVRELMLRERRSFAVPTQPKIAMFALDCVYELSSTNGVFNYAHGADGKMLLNPPSTTRAYLKEAYFDTEKFTRGEAAQREMIKTLQGSSVTSARLLEVNQMRDALLIAGYIKPDIEAFINAMLLLLAKRDSSGRSLLKDFMLDASVLESLDLVLSERLQRRFVKRFGRVKHNGPDVYEEAFTNTVAEFVLMSMGIISPDIFVLQKSEMSEELFAAVSKDMEGTGISMRGLLRHYGLSPEGGFFWNRYKVIGHRPSRITDELIKQFILQTVRADQKELLKISAYREEFFPSVAQICESPADEREEPLRELLIELFGSSEFQEGLMPLLKKWYKHLNVFYKD